MNIHQILLEIEKFNLEDKDSIDEFGPLKIGKRGVNIDKFLCIDGVTEECTTPMVQEFYSYSLEWVFSSLELHWLNPLEMKNTLGLPAIKSMVLSDLDVGGALEGIMDAPKSCVLFCVDDTKVPYQRAYFHFREPRQEPEVIDAGSGIETYKNLKEYLIWWNDVCQA